jgi:hypothetical protein
MADFTNVQIVTVQSNELCATADTGTLFGIPFGPVLVITSPATITHALTPNMRYIMKALWHGTEPQENYVFFSQQGTNNALQFIFGGSTADTGNQ